MKTILYIGEKKDFSDRWLISQLKTLYKIILLDISKSLSLKNFLKKDIDLVLNRLYASAVDRYEKAKISKILNLITKLARSGIPVINLPEGYRMEINRFSQFKYFQSHRLPYIKTYRNRIFFLKDNTFYVMKSMSSSRHKKLLIVKSIKEVSKLKPLVLKEFIFQPLIKQKVCYRTEFIGKWYVTFSQYPKIHNDYLSFTYGNIISTPLSKRFLRKIIKIVNSLKVKTFSIEYFLINKKPVIVDFNCASNYQAFFIKKTSKDLKKVWLKLIQDEIK